MKIKKNAIFIFAGLIIVLGILIAFYLGFQGYVDKQVARKFYLGKNLTEEKNWEKASIIFEEIYKKYPRNAKAADSLFYYAFCLKELGRVDEAVSLFLKITKDYSTTDRVAPSMIMLAKIAEEKGNLKEAQVFYEKVVEEFKDSASLEEAWLGLGLIYEEKGELAEAKSYYDRVVQEFPQGGVYSKAQGYLGNLNIKVILSSYPGLGSFVYKISSGDTLNSIARRFNTTVDLLKEANQLKSARLSLGRRIKVTPNHFNIFVSKAKNILVLKYKDEIVKVYQVATGKFGSTPVGDFKIINKLKNPVWYRHGRKIPSGHPDNILGTRWLGISQASYGIHGTTQPETIGSQATEGCVRMLNKEVEELYKLVTVNTPVKIVE